ncbi:MAG: sugar phosphate isomerase/epimerase family protein [Armatimonadota bacterium]
MDLSRISTCTYPLREEEIDVALKTVAEAGFQKADVWGRMPHFSEDQFLCDWEQLARLSEELGVQVANLGTYPGRFFIAETEQQRQAELGKMQAAIEAASYFGSRSIRVMPGHGEDPSIVEKVTPYFIESARYAKSKGVYLGMENHAGSIAGDPELALHLCENVGNDHFGVLYEPCNLMAGGQDYKEALDVFGDRVVHCHIKDGHRVDDSFSRVHLGDGDVDFVWCVQQLEAAGYDGDYALEYEVTEIEPVSTGLPKWLETFTEALG